MKEWARSFLSGLFHKLWKARKRLEAPDRVKSQASFFLASHGCGSVKISSSTHLKMKIVGGQEENDGRGGDRKGGKREAELLGMERWGVLYDYWGRSSFSSGFLEAPKENHRSSSPLFSPSFSTFLSSEQGNCACCSFEKRREAQRSK